MDRPPAPASRVQMLNSAGGRRPRAAGPHFGGAALPQGPHGELEGAARHVHAPVAHADAVRARLRGNEPHAVGVVAGGDQLGGPNGAGGRGHLRPEFSIWTREAGAGGLSIAVEGPSRAEIAFDDRKDGSCGFNEQHIPDSPYLVPVVAPADDARRLTVAGLQESGLKANHPASFAVRLNGAQGKMEAQVRSPSGALEKCVVSEIERDKYAIRFIPRENGVHTIDVKFNGAHIPGSPFQVRVGEAGQSGEPSLVSAYGAGLERGSTGAQSEFVINNTKAGPGALAVTIEGPSKVKMDCQEVPEGYRTSTLTLDPAVKASGGAPPPRADSSDASMVTCRGPGLSRAYVGQRGSFSVDCSKAGA
ncbi:unnamed protein product [Menidia menidia]|uniref:(Atlantic silverside) hypothetical protein n=1 Tax=Menidia menidia TaxID=238744 RepID=A0A8S4BN53_9TELE|nr:unnamed protein product [Menidia menidia]